MEMIKDKSDLLEPFLSKVSLELKRAERYSVFVSVLTLDLSPLRHSANGRSEELLGNITEFANSQIREIDDCAMLTEDRLAFLFPETNRQGAEFASKRIIELIKNNFNELDTDLNLMITPETASFPDASGAKSIKAFLKEFTAERLN